MAPKSIRGAACATTPPARALQMPLSTVLGEVGVSFCGEPSAILLLFVGLLVSRVCWLLRRLAYEFTCWLLAAPARALALRGTCQWLVAHPCRCGVATRSAIHVPITFAITMVITR